MFTGLPGGSPGNRESTWTILIIVALIGLAVAGGLFWVMIHVHDMIR